MHRIDGPTAAAGRFTGGDPAVPTPATIVTPDWLNAVQEEIVAVILNAGLTPSKTSSAQLLEAIRALITSGGVAFASDLETVTGTAANKAVHPRGAAALVADRITALLGGAPADLNTLGELAVAVGGNANFARDVTQALAARALAATQVLGGGLATGGGTLNGDVTLTVAAASGAELAAGTEGGKALTPAAYATAGGGDGSSGWSPLAGGNILQWGSVTVVGDNTSARAFNIVFPRPFLNVCGSITGNADPFANGANEWHSLVAMFNAPTIAGASGWLDSTQSDKRINGARILRWQAIGR